MKKSKKVIALLMAAFVAVTTVPTQAKAAAGSEKHVLKLGTTYSNYDITGDGEADTIKVSTYAEDKYVKENGDLDHLKITVNGVTAYDKKFHGFSSTSPASTLAGRVPTRFSPRWT